MSIVISSEYSSKAFLQYLFKRILMYFSTVFRFDKIEPLKEYFESDEFKSLYGDVTISPMVASFMGIRNLTSYTINDKTYITINSDIMYPGTNIPVINICKLINYGNASVEGYPIFSKVFDYFTNDISSYVERYGMGVI